jgi:hypothetical protein
MRFSPTVYIYGASSMEVAIELLAPIYQSSSISAIAATSLRSDFSR